MKHYIVGLDPGSTIGFALLDLDGHLIAVDSFKGNLSETISRVCRYGKVIIVGTDVCKIPKSVEKFAARVGAIIVSPNHDLLFHEKRRKTKDYLKFHSITLKDKHQRDALAAALVAYRHYRCLFNRIDNEVVDREISSEVKKIVLMNNISIKQAMRTVEH